MNNYNLQVPVLRVNQPIGQYYVAVIKSSDLIEISSADIRRMEREVDRFVGIQRKLNQSRVKEIGSFVNSIDATFPTSIVLSVRGSCAEFDEEKGILILFEGEDEETGKQIPKDEIANILDGQHRIEGLKNFRGEQFDLPVSIFVEADISDQAFIFATVNLAQTKVNRSLVYDLLDFSKSRSPQKSCHDIAVALDKYESSPLFEMIKRLGTATPGRFGETIAQATFVNSLLPFISADPQEDRERLARGKSVKANNKEYNKTPFRQLWVDNRDTDITRILMEYYGAIAERWPVAWKSRERGDILPRTNGFRAFMRFLRNSYLHFNPVYSKESFFVVKEKYISLFRKVDLRDEDFTIDNFPPGSSGEKRLYDRLRECTGL